ncbi:hypothetical protein AV530_014678 [Patagioenas fasciata monilis]|uniref:Uncharacterized protein n=1 Tax=Patagioenas fasciata monilis TaxID=372326 RepID=A0A1V4KBB0_PATFA|nr:hypothetical protein AV530_014678 [Patagioenas fasciata monilis]
MLAAAAVCLGLQVRGSPCSGSGRGSPCTGEHFMPSFPLCSQGCIFCTLTLHSAIFFWMRKEQLSMCTESSLPVSPSIAQHCSHQCHS